MTKHYKQSHFVLMKSFASLYGQVNKDLTCISHSLVGLLATLPYTSSFHSISNRGKWTCSSRIGALPEVARSASQLLQGNVCLGKISPTSRRIEQAQHGLFSNRGCIQRTSIWVPGGAFANFGIFRIRMLFGKNGYDKVRRFYFFRHIFILHFSNYLNVFSLIVISIMTQL